MLQELLLTRMIKEVTFMFEVSITVTEKKRPTENESKRNNAENVVTFFSSVASSFA